MPNLFVPADKDHVSSNTVTVFSILDTDKGTVESYYFDTKHPNSKAQKFDEFSLVKPAAAAVTTPSEPVTTTSTTASARCRLWSLSVMLLLEGQKCAPKVRTPLVPTVGSPFAPSSAEINRRQRFPSLRHAAEDLSYP